MSKFILVNLFGLFFSTLTFSDEGPSRVAAVIHHSGSRHLQSSEVVFSNEIKEGNLDQYLWNKILDFEASHSRKNGRFFPHVPSVRVQWVSAQIWEDLKKLGVLSKNNPIRINNHIGLQFFIDWNGFPHTKNVQRKWPPLVIRLRKIPESFDALLKLISAELDPIYQRQKRIAVIREHLIAELIPACVSPDAVVSPLEIQNYASEKKLSVQKDQDQISNKIWEEKCLPKLVEALMLRHRIEIPVSRTWISPRDFSRRHGVAEFIFGGR